MTSTASQPAIHIVPTSPVARAASRQPLPGLPRMALSPQQQLEALQRVQNHAEQRVKLGAQLFKAAQAHTLGHRQMLDELKAAGEAQRDALAQEVTQSLREFDQWIGHVEDTHAQAMLALEAKLDLLEAKMDADRQRMEGMIARSEKLLAQTRKLLADWPAQAAAMQAPAASAMPVTTAPDTPSSAHRAALPVQPDAPSSASALPSVNPTAGRPVRTSAVSYAAMLQRLKEQPPSSAPSAATSSQDSRQAPPSAVA